MPKGGADVPIFSYLTAVSAGLFGLPFMYMAAGFVAGLVSDDVDYRGLQLFVSASFFVIHCALGAVFGLLWPEVGWRWGVWLCALPLCLLSFLIPDLRFFAAWCALTMLPACLGAYVAGRLHLKYAEVRQTP